MVKMDGTIWSNEIISAVIILAIGVVLIVVVSLLIARTYSEQKATGVKKIKYAIEHIISLPSHFTDEDIDRIIESVADNRDYIWCEEDKDLFEFND